MLPDLETASQPASVEELAETLAACARDSRRILLGGAFTKDRMGGQAGGDLRVSTAGMNRLLQYEPSDLTISVEAGMKWADLLELLAANRQTVPLDPPFRAQATVGGVVVANTCGPRRRLYGSARDHVIGMKFATLEGKIVDCGGMVVKNVAGLDLGKLMIGSFGTLAAVASVNFKLTPIPAIQRTFLYRTPNLQEAVGVRDGLLKGVLQPAAIDFLNPPAAARVGLEGYALLVLALGSEKVVDRYSRELSSWQVAEGSYEEYLWERLREFTPRFLSEHEQGTVARVSTVLTDLREIAAAPVPLVARSGNGVCYAYFTDVESGARWLQEAVERGWRGVLEYVPAGPCSPEQQWPEPGNDFHVMEKIKHMLDPNRLLNRGRLYGRI